MLLVLSNVEREFRNGGCVTPVLRNVSFSVQAGEFVALVGPSGCGKSTVLNIVGLADRPDRGSVLLAGRAVERAPERVLQELRRSQIGYVFQHFNLLSTLSVRENVMLPLLLKGAPQRAAAARADELLTQVGVVHRAAAFPHLLSGGEMQRVAVARAVVHRPLLVIADEPTGNLDSKCGEQVLELLAGLAATGVGVLMATHSEAAMARCSRVLRMCDGVLQ
jgi:putative ABC transport system ATP-binding protein